MREIKLESCFVGRLALSAIEKMKKHEICNFSDEDYEDFISFMSGKTAADISAKRGKSVSWARYKSKIFSKTILDLFDELITLRGEIRELVLLSERQTEQLRRYQIYDEVSDVFKAKAASLELSRHTKNILYERGYTILDLVQMTPVEFKSIKNIGDIALWEVECKLKELGLKFGMTEFEILYMSKKINTNNLLSHEESRFY